MKAVRNRLARPFGIDRAAVHFAATGEYYAHPEITLFNSASESVIRVRFQTHRLDMERELPFRSRPSDRFDFGFPYAACYAARWNEGMAYGWGSLKAEPNRSEGAALRKLARFHDRIERTIIDYNLSHVEPECELALWVAALERLGVPVEIVRYVGQGKPSLDPYVWRAKLPEDQRHPARDFFDRAASGPSAA